MAIKKPITISVLTIGITSIAAQIILLRELIIVFYGNEISVGIMLASWLLLGAIGSLLLGRFADKVKKRIVLFCGCQLFLSIILPLLIIFIRNIRRLFGFLPGEIVPIGIMIISSPIILAPLCITLGFLFALSCRIFPTESPAGKIGRVYVLESIGAASGGLITSFFLIKYFGSLEILLGLGIINLLAGVILINTAPVTKAQVFIRGLLYTWALFVLILISTGVFVRLEKISRRIEWQPFKIVSSENSIYGNVTVAKRDGQVSFFTNGLHNFTVPDRLAQEEAVHFPFSQHKNPKEVLLIGGGAGGMAWEALKYPIERIDYVEFDPLIIELARRLLKDSKYYALDNPRVNIINADGRFFVKNTPSQYDVIIISIPDPYTAQLNRFYTNEFFREIKRIMKSDAVLSFGVTSSENYISAQLGNFLGSINTTLKGVFPSVMHIPGDTVYFIASQKEGRTTVDYKEISERLRQRGIQTGFVNEYYLFSKLSKERIDYLSGILEKNKTINANFDFRPISYYYDMILWSTYFSFKNWLHRISRIFNPKMIWSAFVLIYLSIICFGLLSRKGGKGLFRSTLTAIGTTGFSEIVFEIVVILSFQIIYGYLYYKLGLMLTSFMVGLFLGSAYITKRLDEIKDPFRCFIKIQIAVAAYPVILPIVLSTVAQGKSLYLSWFGSNIIFPLLPVVAGFIGGLQFPLGNKIYLAASNEIGRTGGLTYGIDLIGACMGAIIVSAFLIPILGIFQTCIAVAILNLSTLFFLMLNYEKD